MSETTSAPAPNGGTPASDAERDRPSFMGRAVGKTKGVMQKRVVREAFVLQIGMVVQMATYLFTSVVLARGLGPHEFGLYTIALTMYSVVFFLANTGVTTASVAQYSKSCAQGDHAGKVLALASFLKVFGLMSVSILSLGALLPLCAGQFYGDRSIGWLAWLLCLYAPIELLNGFMLVVLQGGRRMVDFVMFDNTCGIVRLVVFIFAFLMFARLEGVVIAYLLSGLTYIPMAVLLLRAVRREADPNVSPPRLREILAAIPTAPVREVFVSGSMLGVVKNSGQMVRSFALLLGGNVAPPTELGHFRVAFYYTWAVQQLLNGVNRSLLPAFGFRVAGKTVEPRRFGRELLKVALASGGMFIAITAVAAGVAHIAIPILYGDQYRDSVEMVYILCVGHLALGFLLAVDPFYIYSGQVTAFARRNLVIYAMLIPIGYLLITGFGILGLCWFLGTAVFLQLAHVGYMLAWFRGHSADASRPVADDPSPTTDTQPGAN